MKLLVHMCCANCSLYPVKNLKSKGVELRGLWFNPNIHPKDEYGKRLSALRTLENAWGLDIEYIDHYGFDDFMKAIENTDGDRCEVCYAMRLEKTAETAKQMGLDGFTTTLLVSPHQKFDAIVSVANEMSRKYSVPFYFEDFRHGWLKGITMSRELGLYRQKYCGCILSKQERGIV